MTAWAVQEPGGDVLPFSIAPTEAQAQDLAAAQMLNSWAGLKAAGYRAARGRFFSDRALSRKRWWGDMAISAWTAAVAAGLYVWVW